MIGLYFHVPFCARKCPYCDFYSLPLDDAQRRDYVAVLQREVALRAVGDDLEVDSVYFGGGTPSLLDAAEVARLLGAVREHFRVAADVEITLEVNPGTVDDDRLADFHCAGVNRLSIGAQSFDDRQLQQLGRIHDAAAIADTILAARSVGFDDLSLDLLYSLPGQSRQALYDDLEALLSYNVDHLSCYALTVEPDTPYAHRQRANELHLPDEEESREAFLAVHELLTDAGYHHYEISNFARPGRECRHNQRYWRRAESYLGFGAGAHSFDAAGWGRRLASPDDLDSYRARLGAGQDPRVELERFDRATALAETLYLGLRTSAGVADAELQARFGCTLEEAFPHARSRCGEHLQCVDGRWRFDLNGWLLFNHLISEFL